MEKHISSFFESVGSFFGGSEKIPWSDRETIACFEREVAESDSDEKRDESLMRLAWSLVHSRQQEDVQRGIGMLEASVENSKNETEKREKLYLLAVGYYRTSDYSRSRQLAGICLEMQPGWRQAESLMKVIEDRINKDGLIGIGIAATALGLVAGGIAAIAKRR